MLTLENRNLGLAVSEDGKVIRLHDRRRGCLWEAVSSRRGYRREPSGPLIPFPGGSAKRESETVCARFALPEGNILIRWRLQEDFASVTLEEAPQGIASISLPGPFRPEGERAKLALPLYQGVLLDSGMETFEARSGPGGHGGFSLGMAGTLGERGGLLAVPEAPVNWIGVYGSDQGDLYASFERQPCPVEGWEQPAVRLYPVDANLVSMCKQYRAVVKERGELVIWEEKLSRKPILKHLFGALMAFTGYNADPTLDYVAAARQLKAYGFGSILFYPVRMCHYSLGFKMGGDDPVWLSDEEISALKAIEGVLPAPWGWLFEGLDDGSPERQSLFRRDAQGGFIPHWRIDDYRWYMVCPSCQVEHIRQRFEGDMAAMDWIHFDVSATFPATPCYSHEHAGHGNAPMGKRADVGWTKTLLGPETVGNRIVSSEGFIGHYTPYYDIGTTKMLPGPQIARKTPVPMTMLVYHDSCVHDWWELQNYNALPGWPLRDTAHGLGRVGSGDPKRKAAIDALYGCPPNVFPFGRQYSWEHFETRKTFSFAVRLEEPGVQAALREALPVARLHQKVGPQEMLDFEFLTEDRSVQRTTFAGGTRIVANLGEEAREAEGYGLLPAGSWREDWSEGR